MLRWIVCLLVACGGPQRPAPPSNVTTRPAPPEVPKEGQFTVEHDGPSEDPATGDIWGTVTDEHGEPAAGTTIVATSELLHDELVTIADDFGKYRFTKLKPGKYTLVLYYMDGTFSGDVHVRAEYIARATLERWKPKRPDPYEVHLKE